MLNSQKHSLIKQVMN